MRVKPVILLFPRIVLILGPLVLPILIRNLKILQILCLQYNSEIEKLFIAIFSKNSIINTVGIVLLIFSLLFKPFRFSFEYLLQNHFYSKHLNVL